MKSCTCKEAFFDQSLADGRLSDEATREWLISLYVAAAKRWLANDPPQLEGARISLHAVERLIVDR